MTRVDVEQEDAEAAEGSEDEMDGIGKGSGESCYPVFSFVCGLTLDGNVRLERDASIQVQTLVSSTVMS